MLPVLFVLSITSGCAFAAGLPPWATPCKIGPKFEECVLKSGQAAIPFIAKGDAKYKVPPFDPLVIPEVSVLEDGSKSIAMNITLKDAKFYGLKHTKFLSSKIDLNKRHLELTLEVPRVEVICQYKIRGRFLILPIHGSGPGNVTLGKTKLVFTADYKLEKRKGVEYAVVTKTTLKHFTERIYIKLENLFNGDKALGKNMNEFMNENWKELNDTVGPSLAEAINLFMKQLIVGLLKTTPYREIFLFN